MFVMRHTDGRYLRAGAKLPYARYKGFKPTFYTDAMIEEAKTSNINIAELFPTIQSARSTNAFSLDFVPTPVNVSITLA